jgi:hypothetical protein
MLGGLSAENIYMIDKDGNPLFEGQDLHGWVRFKYLCDTGLKEYAAGDEMDSGILRQLNLEDANPMVFGKPFYSSDGNFVQERYLNFKTLKLENFKMGIQADIFGDSEDEYLLALSYTAPTSGRLYVYDCCLNRLCVFESGCVSSMRVIPGRGGENILEIVTKERNGNAEPIITKKTRFCSNVSFGAPVADCERLYAK